MDKKLELSKLSHDALLEIYKNCNDYIDFLEVEKKKKGTEENG